MVDAGVKTGVRIRYEDPKAVGADRVVDAAAVQRLYGGPACIVDFGTGTTFDAISAEGDYLGGAIAPGIGIAAEALFRADGQAPSGRVGPAANRHRPQYRPCLAVGAVCLGMSGWLRAWSPGFRAELGPKTKVIGTGGLVEIIAAETKIIEIIAPWLTLDGLRIIWEMNR